MLCPHCEYELPDEPPRICPRCSMSIGTLAAEPPAPRVARCQHCGVETRARHCPNCGLLTGVAQEGDERTFAPDPSTSGLREIDTDVLDGVLFRSRPEEEPPPPDGSSPDSFHER